MSWEVFRGRTVRRGRSDRALIRTDTKRSKLTFSAQGTRLVNDVSRVQLLFDPEIRCVGLKPTTDDDVNGYQVTRNANQAWIGCSAFIRHCGIPASGEWEIGRDGNLLTFTLEPEAD